MFCVGVLCFLRLGFRVYGWELGEFAGFKVVAGWQSFEPQGKMALCVWAPSDPSSTPKIAAPTNGLRV